MLTSQRVKSIMQCNDVESLQQYDFPGILKERVVGTPGHDEVKQVCTRRLTRYVPMAHRSYLTCHLCV